MSRLTLALAVLSLAACSAPPDSPGLANKVWEDLPAPEGLTYEGYGHQTADFRSYTQVYRGQRRLDDVAAWFRQAWPAHGWTIQRESDGPPKSIDFTKGVEHAMVAFEDRGRDGLEVTVKIGKKGE